MQGKKRVNNDCRTKLKRTGILLSVLSETVKNTNNTLMKTNVTAGSSDPIYFVRVICRLQFVRAVELADPCGIRSENADPRERLTVLRKISYLKIQAPRSIHRAGRTAISSLRTLRPSLLTEPPLRT